MILRRKNCHRTGAKYGPPVHNCQHDADGKYFRLSGANEKWGDVNAHAKFMAK